MHVRYIACSAHYQQQVESFIRAFESGQEVFEQPTSGSTGIPKTIHITRAQMEASAQSTIQYIGLAASQIAFVCLPIQYIAAKMMLVRALLAQMEAWVVEPTAYPFDIDELVPGKIHFTAFTPYQITRIFERNQVYDRKFLDSIPHILVGGEAIPYALEAELLTFDHAQFYATFGMTETVSHIALKKINIKPDPCFIPLPGVEIDTDEFECLKVKAPVTNGQWITTHDKVQIVTHHHRNGFIWLGRSDFVINSGGVKVQAEVVEKAVEKAFFELQISHYFFVYKSPHPVLQEAVTLYIESENPFQADWVQLLLKLMAENLENKYFVPKKVIFINEFIRTNNGKIDRIKSAEAHERFI